MASTSGDQSYGHFYSNWISQQQSHLHDLQAALESDMREDELADLVSTVADHYRQYYEAKESAAKQNVLQMMSPSWKSPLENAFLWVGGWRPTMVFQLAYAEAGHQVLAELAELLEGTETPSMASLSSQQLSMINDMQTKTQGREEDLSERMATLQQAMADQPLLSLARIEAAGESSGRGQERQVEGSPDIAAAVDDKLKSLEDVVIEADTLRYHTLVEMLEILSAYQAAQYLVAAGHLQLAIRKIGQKMTQVAP